MRFRDIPRVIEYDPDARKMFRIGEKMVLQGKIFTVIGVEADELTLGLAPENMLMYVLSNGDRVTQDEWFERYIQSIDMEPTYEDSREDKTNSIQDDESREGEAKFLPDGYAGEREDDARSVLTKAFDFDTK